MASPVNDKMTPADREGQGLSPHWKKTAGSGKQHWDWMWDFFGPVWFVCNVTKYVMRYRFKEGLKDLYKCRNYLNKLIECEETKRMRQALPEPVANDIMTAQLLESIAQEEYQLTEEQMAALRGPVRHYLPGTSGFPLCGTRMRDDTHWATDPQYVTCIPCVNAMTQGMAPKTEETRG